MLAAIVHDVPHDEKVAFEFEPLDQREFALDLPARALPQLALSGTLVALACAFVGACPQK